MVYANEEILQEKYKRVLKVTRIFVPRDREFNRSAYLFLVLFSSTYVKIFLWDRGLHIVLGPAFYL